MNTVIESVNTGRVKRPVKLLSILLTATGGGLASVSLYPDENTSSDRVITIKAAQDTTQQCIFSGIEYQGGFTVVPGSNVLMFLVEYDLLQLLASGG